MKKFLKNISSLCLTKTFVSPKQFSLVLVFKRYFQNKNTVNKVRIILETKLKKPILSAMFASLICLMMKKIRDCCTPNCADNSLFLIQPKNFIFFFWMKLLIYINGFSIKTNFKFARFLLKSAKKHRKTVVYRHFSDQNGQNLNGL